MANLCPRCGGPVSRTTSTGAQVAAGLVGLMFAAAFGPMTCAKCGKIPMSEFPSDVRTKLIATSAALVVGALLLLGLVLALISNK
jgi:hypothetical protein